MITVKNLTKSFDDIKALDGANLNIPSGSVYGLVGPNGSGKSTMIRNLLGIYKPDAGEITYDDAPIWENPALKARIASVQDDWFFYAQSNVKDMKRIYKGFYPNFSDERYEKLKEAFDIDEKRNIRTLSKGMQKQVAFWLALSTMPDYLILDEPVDGLDPVMRRQVWSLMMSDVSERGTTVLLSSHNLRELEDVCDHVGVMNRGKVLLEHSLSELQDNMVKMQVVFSGIDEPDISKLPTVHVSKVGRVYTLIMRMNAEKARTLLSKYETILVEALPLTLEEIFIYEMEGEEYAIKEILL